MSGDAPLRYGSPLSWPLVPPLADDDEDSVELPSTVDVKAIWDLPQPGDGTPRAAQPASVSSTPSPPGSPPSASLQTPPTRPPPLLAQSPRALSFSPELSPKPSASLRHPSPPSIYSPPHNTTPTPLAKPTAISPTPHLSKQTLAPSSSLHALAHPSSSPSTAKSPTAQPAPVTVPQPTRPKAPSRTPLATPRSTSSPPPSPSSTSLTLPLASSPSSPRPPTPPQPSSPAAPSRQRRHRDRRPSRPARPLRPQPATPPPASAIATRTQLGSPSLSPLASLSPPHSPPLPSPPAPTASRSQSLQPQPHLRPPLRPPASAAATTLVSPPKTKATISSPPLLPISASHTTKTTVPSTSPRSPPSILRRSTSQTKPTTAAPLPTSPPPKPPDGQRAPPLSPPSLRSTRRRSPLPTSSPPSAPGSVSTLSAASPPRGLLQPSETAEAHQSPAAPPSRHLHSSSDGDESDIDSDSWSSGSGGRDSDSESCGWSDVAESVAGDGAAPVAQPPRAADTRQSPAPDGERPGSALDGHPVPAAVRRRPASPDSSCGAPVSRDWRPAEPPPTGERRAGCRPRHRPQSAASPARGVRWPAGAASPTPEANSAGLQRPTGATVSPKTGSASVQSPQRRPAKALNNSSAVLSPAPKVDGRLQLSGSDDSDFDVGGVHAALQSLEDDAESAERVTTPEKQTWWKNKLKHSAMGRAESAHSLVRPWESRRDMGRTNARHSAGIPVTVKGPSQPPAAVGNGKSKRVGASVDASATDKHQRAAVALSESSEGEEGWCSPAEDSANGSDRRSPCVKIDGRTSPRYAMPLTSDSHVRKPSLSVILNLENKNSHLRGMCPPRNSDYDGAPKSRDSELAGALKSPAQVQGSEEPSFAPPVSRSRGRPKPSESAPPPRTSEVMAPPRNAPSLSTETKGWPAGGESNSTNSVQGGREPVPRVAATPVSGTLAAPSSEPSVPESGGPTRPVSQSPPWAEDKGRPPATTAGLVTSDAQQRQSMAELLNSPSSHHGSPASSSSFSSSSALVTTTAATDTGAAASPAPRPAGSKVDGTDPDQGGDPARNSRSMLIRRRRIKLLKRRHKNIVDPVLLADVEELVRRLAGLGMPRGAGRTASNSGEVRTPACFQTRKYGRKRKPPQEKVAKPDREAVDDVDKKKSNSHHTPVCPQEDENKEQCLPLKKRYHHISQSLAESISSLAKSASLPAKAGFCAMESTTACKSTAPRAEKVSDKLVNKAQELYSPGDTGKGPDRVNSVESLDHPSVICKALVKRQCVESSTKSVTSKVPCKLTLTKSEQASKKQSVSRSRAQSGDGSHSRTAVHKAQTPDRPENQKQTAKHKASDLVDGGQKLNAKADEKGAVSANKRTVTATSDSAPPASTRLAGTAGPAAEGFNAVSSTKKSDDVQTPGGDKTRAVSLPGPEDRRRRRRPTADTAPSGHPGRRRRWRRRPRSGSERPDSKTESTAECPPVPSPPPADVPTVSAPVPTPDTAPPSGIPASCPEPPAVSVTVEAVAARSDSVPAKVESDPPPVGDVCPAPCAEGPADTPAKSPQDTAALTVRRKRRKINRTGFPNKKKKVRLKSRPPTPGSTAAAPEPAVALPEAPQPDGEPTAVPSAASLAAADKDLLQSECLGADTEPPAEATPARPEHTAMGEQRARELRRPRRPAPARPRPTQLQQTPVVRLDKMSEPPVAPPRHEQPPSGAASDTGSEAAPPRSEPADTGRPAGRPTSHRLATRKRSKATTSPAPNNKRARVDRTDLSFVEDDIYFESDPLISESGPSSEVPSGDELHRSAATTVKTRMAAPKWKKKKYITAGLFSDFYKVESESERPELNKSRLTYDPSEHEHGLLPPPCYEEKWLRHRPRDFTLPYDLWWLQANGQLPGRDAVASWNYKKLRTNYYFDVKPPPPREVEACSCRPPVDPQRPGCGDDCINRMMFVECSSSSCPCGDRCDNQRIQRHRWTPGLVKFMTGEKGWGIMTRRPIRAGTFILEYVGEIVSEKEFKRRMQTRYINDQHHYCLNLDRGMVIDGHRMGSIGRFVNHSCSPNCEMQKWEMNGLHRMALFSKEDIPGGTELTYDYNFALFNPAVGQKCHCGSEDCRGVIGGRSQRVGPPQTERGRGRGAGTSTSSTTTSTTGVAASTTAGAIGPGDGGAAAPAPAGGAASAGAEPSGAARNERRPSVSSEQTSGETAAREPTALPVRPLSARDVRFIRLHRSFLVRNYEKMRRQREPPLETARPVSPPAGSQEETFRAHLRALDSSRSVRTRRLAAAEDDPQMVRTLKLAHILKEIHQAVVASTGEHPGPSPVEALTLPRRPRVAAARDSAEAPCSLLPEPLDIAEIERHIVTGQYKTADAFDHDFRRLFTAQLRAHGRCSPIGAAVLRLKHKYAELKTVMMSQIQEVLGVVPSSFRPPAKRRQDTGLDGEEDTIRCVCSLHREEGLMIQCERCLVWQHCDCVDADPDVEKYACELCEPRYLSPEVRLKPQPEDAEPGLTYYLSLMRDQLQVRQGDCVYIMQGDMVRAAQEAGQVPYKFVKRLVPDELLIFRVEKLWKDESGARFAFGYHYCRPQETYHEPTRKFFPKEVMRSPLYEVVPLELVVGTCWVLDVNTYCKGRPVGASEHSVYVCEYRVDKTARLFAKLTKNRHPICTEAFAFDSFETRLKISRTFTPHAEEVAQKMKTEKVKAAKRDEVNAAAPKAAKPKVVKDSAKQAPPPVKVETPDEKLARQVRRLDTVLLRLLARLPGPPLDVSQMLGPGKRHRRRPAMARV